MLMVGTVLGLHARSLLSKSFYSFPKKTLFSITVQLNLWHAGQLTSVNALVPVKLIGRLVSRPSIRSLYPCI